VKQGSHSSALTSLLQQTGSIEKAKASMLKAFQKDQATLKSDIIHAIMENNVDAKDLFKAIDKHESDSLQSLRENLVQGIPKPINRLFAGMARVDRDDFFARYDTGVPQDETMTGNEQVLLLYSHSDALPPDHEGKGIPLLPVEEATQHCNTLKVVFTEADKRNECLAIVGQFESYHVHKFMRLPEDPAEPQGGEPVAVSPSNPLRHVSRLHLDSGLAQRIPTPPKVKEYNAQLVRYLSSLDSILDELRPVAEKVAKNDTIVVMVCNHGQSELLMNFVCSSRARGMTCLKFWYLPQMRKRRNCPKDSDSLRSTIIRYVTVACNLPRSAPVGTLFVSFLLASSVVRS
jgi:hypothetical protein